MMKKQRISECMTPVGKQMSLGSDQHPEVFRLTLPLPMEIYRVGGKVLTFGKVSINTISCSSRID